MIAGERGYPMAEISFDFPSSFFAALRKSPAEFAAEMRLAAAIHWYSQGVVSQGKASEIAGVSRAQFLEELHRRKVPAIQVTAEELEEELRRAR
jgi:predicted HTH domain antitoxin